MLYYLRRFEDAVGITRQRQALAFFCLLCLAGAAAWLVLIAR